MPGPFGLSLVGLALVCLSFAGCDRVIAPAPQDHNGLLVRVAEDEPRGLDPQLYSDLATVRIASEQFEGLTRMSASGTVEPGLSDRWTTSADGLRWRFHLRPGLSFADGHPVAAATFAAIFSRLKAKDTASPVAELFDSIRSVEASGKDEVLLTLDHPYPALLELLTHPAMAALPLHRANWSEERPIIASGAYRVADWRLNDRIRLERNPHWHGGLPAIAAIEWRPVTDGLTAIRMFRSGEADIAGDVPGTRLPSLRQQLGAQVRVAPYRGSYYFAFNTRKPPFNDVRVRQALSMAVERDWLATGMMKTGVVPSWSVVPANVGLTHPYRPGWANWNRARRMETARALLAQAGYGDGKPLRFEIRFNSDADHRRVAVALSAMWKPLGVEATLLNSEASLHFASLRRGEFALARSGWIGDVSAPENFLAVHRSDAGTVNYSGYANPAFDHAFLAAMQISNPEQRAEALSRAEALMMADVPVLPLWTYVSKALVSRRVGGWQDNPANIHPSRTLWMRKP